MQVNVRHLRSAVTQLLGYTLLGRSYLPLVRGIASLLLKFLSGVNVAQAVRRDRSAGDPG